MSLYAFVKLGGAAILHWLSRYLQAVALKDAIPQLRTRALLTSSLVLSSGVIALAIIGWHLWQLDLGVYHAAFEEVVTPCQNHAFAVVLAVRAPARWCLC